MSLSATVQTRDAGRHSASRSRTTIAVRLQLSDRNVPRIQE